MLEIEVQLIEDAIQFLSETMTCGGCVRGVTKAIQGFDSAATVQADPPNRQAEVTTNAPRDQIVAALTEAGCAPA